MDIEGMIITKHAKDRFIERLSKMGACLPPDPEKSIRKLIEASEPDDSLPDHVRVRRLMNNNLRDAQYRKSQGWRFVILDGRLLTAERIKPHMN